MLCCWLIKPTTTAAPIIDATVVTIVSNMVDEVELEAAAYAVANTTVNMIV